MPSKKTIAAAAGVAAAATGIVAAAVRRGAKPVVYRVASDDDGWSVKALGSERASSRHGTKKEAVSAGRELARSKAPSHLVIHRADGSVQSEHDYAVDGA